jgi:biopolymer transport protein ExbB
MVKNCNVSAEFVRQPNRSRDCAARHSTAENAGEHQSVTHLPPRGSAVERSIANKLAVLAALFLLLLPGAVSAQNADTGAAATSPAPSTPAQAAPGTPADPSPSEAPTAPPVQAQTTSPATPGMPDTGSPTQSALPTVAGAPEVPPIGEGSMPAIGKSQLPQDLSPWGMYQSADIVVKAVMIGLIIASIVTWTVWLAKMIELAVAKRNLRQGLRRIANVSSLAEAARSLGSSRGVIGAQVEAATAELALSASLYQPAGIKERVLSCLQRIEAGAGRGMTRGTGVLATIGATAPFVGLFGTVWGIMNSFIGISKSQTTNLAVVAPGIAEALLATAFGLVAAIPAVIIYNHFTRSIAGYKALVADASALVMRLLSRDLDRGIPHVSISRAAE